MVGITQFRPLPDLKAEITFTDGTVKNVDLSPYLHGPVFEEIRRDPEVFRSATVDPELRTVVWPNGADLCPDTLYEGLPPARLDPRND
jgi:hypothetical protein